MRLLALALLLAPCVAAGAEIELFSPQGDVKDVRQVAVRFSEDVVDFGDPRLPAPFEVSCAAPGDGRWADARNWVYDFEHDLDAGLACTFKVAEDFRDRRGRPLRGQQRFAFTTGGPAIRRSLPYAGNDNIDENQVFILALDAPATTDSIEDQAWCEADGIGERIPLRVLSGDERRQLLEQRRQLGYAYLQFIVVRDADARVVGGGRIQSRQQLEAAESKLAVVQCRRTLPARHRVSLVWGAGIATAGGATTQQAQRLDFRVRDDFLARFSCRRASADADCLPMLPMAVEFTAPVDRALAERATLVSASGTPYRPEPLKEDRVETITFAGPFAERDRLTLSLPDGLVDDAGRTLANRERFPLEVKTDEAPPLAKFAGTFGILERLEGGILPVTLRNLDGSADGAASVAGRSLRIDDPRAIYGWMQKIDDATRPQWRDGDLVPPGTDSVLAGARDALRLDVIKPGGARELEVVAIPLREPGLYVVELESPRLGRALNASERPYYVPTMALVTDLSVHLQWGLESSAVWVTRLHDGTVVADAAVEVLDACTGQTLWSGTTAADGVATIADGLPAPQAWTACNSYAPHDLLVAARAGDDFSFALASWHDGITPGEFGNIASNLYGGAQEYAHSVLDRALYRAGETVSMKHYLRDPSMAGLRAATLAPDRLVIRHGGSGKSFELPLRFDAGGIAESSWTIPKDAPLGSYALELHAGTTEQRYSGSFRVEQYKLPTARAQIQGPRAPLIGAGEVQLDLDVSYLAGGGAAYLPVKLRTLQQAFTPQFKHYEAFRFGGEPVQEGLSEESAGGWLPEFDDSGQALPTATMPAQTLPLTLDRHGAARVTTPLVPSRVAQDLL
ncbi:MAG: MG2 domain-containing protein, partial [Gammaproteobacteria bacterium]